jgi:hypothetical protein
MSNMVDVIKEAGTVYPSSTWAHTGFGGVCIAHPLSFMCCLLCLSSSCVPNFASFSGLSIGHVWHHYAQANTNNINKTWALLQTIEHYSKISFLFISSSVIEGYHFNWSSFFIFKIPKTGGYTVGILLYLIRLFSESSLWIWKE